MRRESNNRIKWVHLRLSVDEHKVIMQLRSKSTCRNLSEYIRNVIFDRPIIATYRNLSQDDMLKHMASLNRELNGIGNNLNQVTKRLHTLKPIEQAHWANQFEAQIETIQLEIKQVKELMLKITERWLR
jgi:hypothetical protein